MSNGLKVLIHRGSDQIGGNIIEVASDTTRIMLDAGTELDAPDEAPLPEIPGLFDEPRYDAVFFSHNHLDHIGLAQMVHSDIPLYAGEKALGIMKAMAEYLGKPLGFSANAYEHNTPITIGDLKVTPFIMDHSAFDAYMLLVECGNESVLYSGDFRSTGRKLFDKELMCLPCHVDTLICEGTNLGNVDKPSISEHDLEERATELFRHRTGPVFVLQASSNIDRIVTMYRAAKRSGRIFIEDLFMAEIAQAATPTIPNPDFDDVRVYIDRYYDNEHHRYRSFDRFGVKKIGRTEIATQKFVMCIRTSMLGLLRSLAEKMDFTDGMLVYSMWSGYRNKPEMVRLLQLAQEFGLTEVTIHNSGHADTATIKRLVERVSPDRVMPVHTENKDWWREHYPDLVI